MVCIDYKARITSNEIMSVLRKHSNNISGFKKVVFQDTQFKAKK